MVDFRADDDMAAAQGEGEAAIYEAVPLTAQELAVSAAGDWGLAEDWSDWLRAIEEPNDDDRD